MYAQDAITKGNFLFSVGIRGDLYNALSTARMIEPRAGIAYNVKRTGTVLRVSYARTMETPFNENLVLSSRGCSSAVIADLIPCVPSSFAPGQRNEFHAGLQQQLGKHLVFNGDYIWKYTHNGYDFSVLGATPVTFPIEWKNSKIPGFAIGANVPEVHGFTAFVTMSSVAARFFSPQIGGLGTTVGQVPGPFRIDHDERFNQTTHAQYSYWAHGPCQERVPRTSTGAMIPASSRVPCRATVWPAQATTARFHDARRTAGASISAALPRTRSSRPVSPAAAIRN